MYSKEIQKLKTETTISVIKAIILFGLFITLFFVHMSMLYHVISACLCGYYIFKNLSKVNYNYMKIIQLESKQAGEKEYNKFRNKKSYDEFNRILDDLYEKFNQEQQNKRTYSNSYYDQSSKLKNAYLLFKLPSTSTVEEIKSKYRELAFKWHPDKWTTDTISNQNTAKRNFQKLQTAYDLIKKDKGIN